MNPSDLIEAELSFAVDLNSLLSPLPDGDGVGVSLRTDPVWQQIRDAQLEDDPSLPMGEWERPLVKADWNAVASLCGDALRLRSKDFHLVVWLCEAWARLYRLEGLMAGMQLLNDFVDRFWELAYPKIDGEDRDARAAPLHWISRRLEIVLKLHVPLIGLPVEPGYVNLDDWQRVVAASVQQDDDAPATHLPREMLDREAAQGSNLALLRQLERTAGTVQSAIDALSRRLDQLLGDDAPSFTRVTATLGELQRAARALRGNHALDEQAAAVVPAQLDDARPIEHDDTQLEVDMQARVLPVTREHIVDRSHAYRLLEEIARYLAEHEPHSPTPYLLARAVNWGRMPLPDLMRDIVSQEGDLGRYLAMLDVEL